MKYLVTGGAGFIGSNIVRELLSRGESVRVLDNLATGRRENLEGIEKQIELIEGDVRSYHIVREAVEGRDVVLHQAALPSVPRSVRDPITSNEVNVVGTLNILQAAREGKAQKVVFASSSSIYGDTPELPKHEGMSPNPQSPYAVSKLAAEKYCSVFSKIYGLETVSLRYFNVFGPWQDPNSQYSAVIPKFIAAMMRGESPVIFGDGEQSRDFTFITNVVSANLLAAATKNASGLAMNCACHQRVTLNELVARLNTILGTKIQATYRDARPGDVKHSYAAIDLIQSKLGYQPTTSFDDGLQKTVDWYRQRKV